MKGENINLLTESEWRTIHNALAKEQSQTGSIKMTDWARQRRAELQHLMDKIRDNYIAPYAKTTPS